MNTKLSHVVSMVYGRPWYLREDEFKVMDALVRMHMAGERLSGDEIRERLDAAAAKNGPRAGARMEGAIGVIPIYGMIFPRSNLMTEMSGGATVTGIRAAFRAAMADESIGSILFDIDSPGGYTDGIDELATEIRSARGTKPMVSISNYSMASAAYYLGSQADEVVASPSSMTGWVGTVLVHQEFSKADEQQGVTTTIFRDPPGKFGGNEYEPLSDTARAELQQQVDDFSGQFYNAAAKGRGISTATVKSDFGQGGGMSAQRAKSAGLVDRVETIDDTVRRMAQGKVQTRGRVAASWPGFEVLDVGVGDGDPNAIPLIDPAVAAALEGRIPDPEPIPEPGPPTDRSREAAAALALARARTGR